MDAVRWVGVSEWAACAQVSMVCRMYRYQVKSSADKPVVGARAKELDRLRPRFGVLG